MKKAGEPRKKQDRKPFISGSRSKNVFIKELIRKVFFPEA